MIDLILHLSVLILQSVMFVDTFVCLGFFPYSILYMLNGERGV